jgi:hypothetical protein
VKCKSVLLYHLILDDTFLIKIISDYGSEKLEVLLNMLKLPELRLLCQTFRIPSAAQSKSKLIQALMQYGQSQQTICGSQRGDSIAIIKSRYLFFLPNCIALVENKYVTKYWCGIVCNKSDL